MIAMLDTSHNLDECAKEIGCGVNQLLTPLTRFKPQRPDEHFAIDNGAFAGFDAKAFRALLEREKPRIDLCRFVSVPDIVGRVGKEVFASARRTLEVFDVWYAELCQWPLALVAQDGQEDLPIPWKEISAIFIGGTTEWKMSVHAAAIIKTAQALDKWVHVGRVNEPKRFKHFEKLGVNSIDGTGISLYSHMRLAIKNRNEDPNVKLDFDEVAA